MSGLSERLEALATKWGSLPEPPDEDYEGTTEGHWAFGEWLAMRDAAKQLRAALASEGTDTRPSCAVCGPGYRLGDEGCRHSEGTDALAKVRADALREWISEWPADPDDGTFLGDVARDGLERADRIEAGDGR